ncbi:Rho GDP-dissociation inhibitor, partial [Leucoagaricus sp. SymC.cos]
DDIEADLKPTTTPGYNPGGSKSPEELAKLDAEDESLARWKASLGITPGSTTFGNGPKASKTISLDVTNPAAIEAATKKKPIIIKEGVEYNVRITFKVNHSIISGARYIQVVKSTGVKDKLEQMLGSYGPNPSGEPYHKNFDSEESPSGMMARILSYNVHSRVVDDDGEIYGEWKWHFKLAKEWE